MLIIDRRLKQSLLTYDVYAAKMIHLENNRDTITKYKMAPGATGCWAGEGGGRADKGGGRKKLKEEVKSSLAETPPTQGKKREWKWGGGRDTFQKEEQQRNPGFAR